MFEAQSLGAAWAASAAWVAECHPRAPGTGARRRWAPSPLGAVDAVPYHGPLGHLTAGWPVSPFLGKAYSLPWGLARVGLLVSENEGGNWKKPEGEREVAQARGMCGDKPRSPDCPRTDWHEHAQAAPVGGLFCLPSQATGAGGHEGRRSGGCLEGVAPQQGGEDLFRKLEWAEPPRGDREVPGEHGYSNHSV